MPNEKGIQYLRDKLNTHKLRVDERYKQYDMKKKDWVKGITIPDKIRARFTAVLGWCTKAVDSLADRLIFRKFDDGEGDIYGINEIFRLNNPDTLFDSAILNALISSCSFIYISKDDEGMPRLQVIEANNATGVIDPITGLLTEGYAVLKRDELESPELEAYFLPYQTQFITRKDGKEEIEIFTHEVGHPLLVPIVHRPDAVRPFGRSRITRSAEYYQKYAKSIFERADITAEFYSFPQKYVTGLSQDAEGFDTWKNTISSMLAFTKDDNGESPKLGQFTTPSMSPFTEQLRTAASGFAGETGLTLDDLGFVSDNPSSSEAIKASHETLRAMAKKAQRCFSSGFKNVAFLSVCLRDEYTYRREEFSKVTVKWEPVFESDISTLSLVGDAVNKINQSVEGYFDKETLRDLTGIEGGVNAK